MKTKAIVGALCASVLSTLASAEPFTYQGSLDDNGSPANGEYDFNFFLYDAQAGGNQIGSLDVHENTMVTDGVFTVELDFGDELFLSGTRYLEIRVRPGDSGAIHDILTPRTQVNPAPIAHHAFTAGALANPIWNESGNVIYTDGTTNRVFINREEPITSAEYFGIHADTTDYVGMYISGPAGSFPFYGYSVDGDVSAFTYFNSNDDSWNVVGAGSISAMRVTSDNNVHISRDIYAESYQFETPKLNYLSISGDSFYSGSGDDFFASGGSWGAYISNPGSGWLVAPVNLPHGSTVTRMRVYFDDTSPSNMNVRLRRIAHGATGAGQVAFVDTTGFAGTSLQVNDNAPTGTLINNNLYHYHLRVYSDAWPGNSTLRIKSVVIEYTTDEAQ